MTKHEICEAVREELFCVLEDLTARAGDLEEIGVKRESAKLRRIAGELEAICFSLEGRFKRNGA